MRLRRFDGDLIDGAVGKLGQERVGFRFIRRDDKTVTEAEMNAGRHGHAFERAINNFHAIPVGAIQILAQPRLVQLYYVRASSFQIAHFGIHGLCIRKRCGFFVVVEIIRRLLAHGERTGQGHLDRSIRMAL